MDTNVYHQARQADPFSPELSPALWLLPKGPSPKEAIQLTETLDYSVNDRPALASRQTSRLVSPNCCACCRRENLKGWGARTR
jgi:hypothetical protein